MIEVPSVTKMLCLLLTVGADVVSELPDIPYYNIDERI